MSARDLLLQKGPLTFGVVSLVLLLSYVIIQPHLTSQWGMQGTDTIDKERDGHQQWTPTTTYEATGVTVGGPYISQRQQQEQHHQQHKQQQYHQQQQTEGQLQQQQNQQQQQQQQQHQQTEQKQQPFTTTTLRDIATTHFPSAMSTTPKDESNSNNSCQFPNQNPFDPDVMKHFVKPPSLNCSRDTLPSIVYHNGTHLRVNQTKVLQIHVDFQYCYYVSLSRDSERVVSHSRRSQSFTNSIELDKQHIDVVVTCMLNKTRVAKSYISIIRKNDQIEISCQENYKNHVYNNSPVETLSVLMIGLDGTSRQNSIRSLLMSRQFLLQNLSAIELYKYNKVGDNTFPNVVALLTGMSIEELSKHWTRKDHFDKVDDFFLWNDYKSAGYRTAMMFDDSWLTTFHYLRKGWKDPPFHYYHRNMLVELQKHKNKRLCIGDTPKVTHLLNYYIELCTTFNNTRTQPYFAYAFSSMITHNDPNLAVLADSVYLDFFRELSRRNVLNNTLVIWFSDHGARFGPIRETRAGVMESKTPFIFFVFPEWFRNKYSDVMDSFRKNQHTLTTPYDVYATLKDLLYFKGSHTTMGQLSSRGISLFKEIPRERTCKHAGVPTEFCMCSRELKNYTILPEVEFEVASIVLESVVNATSQYRDVCVVLKLESIKSIYPSAPPEFDKCSKCVNFLTTIEVCPSGGEYEATVQYNPETGKSRVRGEIIRLNMYKGQADCVDTPSLRLFCYCKHQ